jgi:hypothetical protein
MERVGRDDRFATEAVGIGHGHLSLFGQVFLLSGWPNLNGLCQIGNEQDPNVACSGGSSWRLCFLSTQNQELGGESPPQCDVSHVREPSLSCGCRV